MAPQPDQKHLNLPRWATLVLPKTEKETEDVVDEAYLRTRCFHILSERMDQAMDQVLESSLSPCLKSAQEFLDATAPNKLQSSEQQEHLQPPKRPRLSPVTEQQLPAGFDADFFDSASASKSQHDPLLLPVLLLNGPSIGLDRQHQVEHLIRSMRKARPRSAVVQVPNPYSTSSTTNHKHRNSWMASLVLQCHNLLPILDVEPLKRRVIKRNKKACAFTDMLLLWAQSVTCYDEIVAFLETDECCYSSELLDFLHLLASRRAEQGIPLSVVMLSPHEGRRQIELRSSHVGYAGFAIRSYTLPSPEELLEEFWHNLMLKQQFPVSLPPTVLDHIRQSFVFHQNSSYRTMAKLKQFLAHFFSRPGSFLAVANSEPVLEEQWQRIAWFLVDENARQVVLGDDGRKKVGPCTDLLGALEEMDMRHRKALLVLQVLQAIKTCHDGNNSTWLPSTQTGAIRGLSTSCANSLRVVSRKDLLESLLLLRRENLPNPSHGEGAPDSSKTRTDFADQTDVAAALDPIKPASLLKKHLAFCSPQQVSTSGNDAKRQQTLVDFLNELIVLVGKCRDADNLAEIEEVLTKVVDDWTFHRGDRNKDYARPVHYRHEWSWMSHPPEYDWEVAIGSFVAEPRRNLVAALIRGPLPALDPTALPEVAGTMYELIHDRVAIEQEEWYELFWNQGIAGKGADCSREKSFSLFSSGLRYLKLCGLISERLRVGSKSDIICERAKLVWCGGDSSLS